MRRLLLISASLLATVPASAQTVDADGASKILRAVSAYLSQQKLDEKVIKVLPEGDNYRVTLNLNEVLKLFPEQGLLKGYFTKFDMLAKPLADGTWNISSDQIPTAYIDPGGIIGDQKLNLHTGDESWTAQFDSNLGMLRTISFDVDYLSIGHEDSNYYGRLRAELAKGKISIQETKSGGIDFDLRQTFGALDNLSITKRQQGAGNSTIQTPVPRESVPQKRVIAKTTLRSGSARVDVTGKNIRTRGIFDLLAFFFNPTADKLREKSDQIEWGQKLVVALPFWDKLSFVGEYNDVVLETPFGNLSTKSAFHQLALDGASKSSQYSYDLRLKGMEYPTSIFPAESLTFLPTDIELAIGMEGLDLETWVRKLAADLTLEAEDPSFKNFDENRKPKIQNSSPRFVISKGIAHVNGAELTLTGEITFVAPATPSDAPAFDSTTKWEISDFDGVLGRLIEASQSEPQLKEIAAFAKLAKDFGRPMQNGRMQWIVNQQHDGLIFVNDRLAVQVPPVEPPPRLMDEGILVHPRIPR